ncbi:MAG: hypothetical protein WBD09_07250 [Halobacteriota archaeon]
MSRQRLRVILEAKGIRSFIWIDEGKDGSIYFGLSDPNAIIDEFGKITPPHVDRINPEDGKRLDFNYKGIKISYHASGRLYDESNEGNRLLPAFQIAKPVEVKDYLTFAVIIPQKTDQYPLLQKKKKNLALIKTDIFENKPFQVELFIAGKKFEVKKYNEAQQESRGRVYMKEFSKSTLGVNCRQSKKNFYSTFPEFTYIILRNKESR